MQFAAKCQIFLELFCVQLVWFKSSYIQCEKFITKVKLFPNEKINKIHDYIFKGFVMQDFV